MISGPKEAKSPLTTQYVNIYEVVSIFQIGAISKHWIASPSKKLFA